MTDESKEPFTEKLTSGDSPFEPLTAPFGAKIQSAIMPLFMEDDGEFVSIGTGFMIGGNGLMMTAAHVIREAISKGRRELTDAGWADQAGLYAFYASAEKHGPQLDHHVGGLWPIPCAWVHPDTDVACCWLRNAEIQGKPITFPALRLSPGLPAIGDSVTAFGYTGQSKTLEHDAEGRRVLPYDVKGFFSKGRIIQVHEMQRDVSMLSFPCFHTDMRLDAGMSGGPVVNDAGSVCGVVCDSFGYASLLWLAMGLQIWIAPEPGEAVQPTPVLNLIESGYVKSDGTERNIRVTRVGDDSYDVRILRTAAFGPC